MVLQLPQVVGIASTCGIHYLGSQVSKVGSIYHCSLSDRCEGVADCVDRVVILTGVGKDKRTGANFRREPAGLGAVVEDG